MRSHVWTCNINLKHFLVFKSETDVTHVVSPLGSFCIFLFCDVGVEIFVFNIVKDRFLFTYRQRQVFFVSQLKRDFYQRPWIEK